MLSWGLKCVSHVFWVNLLREGLFLFILSGLGFLEHESTNSQIPVWVQGMSQVLACPDGAHMEHPTLSVSCDTVWKWSKNRHAAASKHFSSRCAAASVSIFPSCNHMCTTGNNRVLCCSFMAERMFLNPAVCTAVLHCWTETEGRECVREREGGFEGWSHRAYFGFSDDSPAGCGLWCGCPMWGKPLSSSVLGQLLAFGQFSKHS